MSTVYRTRRRRIIDAIVEKLNTTFQEELKQEIEARSFFLD